MHDINSTYRTLLEALFRQTLKSKTNNILSERNLLNNSLTEVLIVSLWLYFFICLLKCDCLLNEKLCNSEMP